MIWRNSVHSLLQATGKCELCDPEQPSLTPTGAQECRPREIQCMPHLGPQESSDCDPEQPAPTPPQPAGKCCQKYPQQPSMHLTLGHKKARTGQPRPTSACFTPYPRNLLPGQPGVTYHALHSMPQEIPDCVTQSNQDLLHHGCWDSPIGATWSNSACTPLCTTGELYQGDLQQASVPSQRPQNFAESVLSEGPRAPPCHRCQDHTANRMPEGYRSSQ